MLDRLDTARQHLKRRPWIAAALAYLVLAGGVAEVFHTRHSDQQATNHRFAIEAKLAKKQTNERTFNGAINRAVLAEIACENTDKLATAGVVVSHKLRTPLELPFVNCRPLVKEALLASVKHPHLSRTQHPLAYQALRRYGYLLPR
jgi:hypothetical protein